MERKLSRKLMAHSKLLGLCSLFFIGFMSCVESGGKKTDENIAVQQIKDVFVPINIVEPSAKREYLIEHFWDSVSFKDTMYIIENTVLEKAFVDYLYVSEGVILDSMSKRSVNLLLEKAENGSQRMFNYVFGLYEKYLYSVDSPMRNDDMYVEVLDYVICSSKLDSLAKIRPRYQLNMMLNSSVGHEAKDFAFLTHNEEIKRLYSIESDYVMLFFYSKGCEICDEIRDFMQNSPIFESPRLVVVEVDIDSEESLKEMYDVRATPCLFLLNDDKIILLKDIEIEQLEQYLLDIEL
ncbi:MAG: DUF5106 domain-containing protein [Rikenellaceae bacterium]